MQGSNEKNDSFMMWVKVAAITGALIALAVLSQFLLSDERYKIEVSHETGFYDDEIALSLYSSKGDIYYTLDSTAPSENSTKYVAPIILHDASQNENVYSVMDGTVIGYDQNLINLGIVEESEYPRPDYPVDKCNVLRAICVDEHGVVRDEIIKSYFIGFNDKKAFFSLPIVSIVSDPENLFGHEKGILVTGKTMSDYVDDLDSIEDFDYNAYPANYNRRGSEWERDAKITIFAADRTCIWDGNCGIRTQGGSSRDAINRNYNIFNREEEKINATVLGFEYDLNSLTLFGGAGDNKMKLKDIVVNTLVTDRNVVTRKYVPCELFIEGEFWGVFYMVEKMDEEFFENHYSVSRNSLEMMKNSFVEIGKDNVKDDYENLIEYIVESDMSDSECFDTMCKYIDIDSMLDYYAIEMYVANDDWPISNMAFWRTRDYKKGESYSDGRWRYALFDVNLALECGDVNNDWITHTAVENPVFASLTSNDYFMGELKKRMYNLAVNEFNPSVALPYITACEEAMAPAMEAEFSRYYLGSDFEGYHDRCQGLRDFFEKRYNYITEAYAAEGVDN